MMFLRPVGAPLGQLWPNAGWIEVGACSVRRLSHPMASANPLWDVLAGLKPVSRGEKRR